MVDEALGQIGRQAAPIPVHVSAQCRVIPSMPVMDDRSGLVHELPTARHHLEEGGQVISAAGTRAGAQGRVEPTHRSEGLRVEGHVGA
jgi:hypothetical protein